MKRLALVALASALVGSPARVRAQDLEPAPANAAPVIAVAPAPSAEDGAPSGRAAPPTESGRALLRDSKDAKDATLRAGLEVFAQYGYRRYFGAGGAEEWFHAFDVPRVHGAIEGTWDGARGRVVLEATRSASEGSLVGVAGDSLVLRVREAYGAYRPIPALEIAAGVVPTLTVPNLDGTWMLRAVAPSALEAAGLLGPADIGAKARFDAPGGYGWIATAATNGDGYNSRELNRGKTVETAGELHPLPHNALRPLGIFASYVNGSTGTTLARANRLTGGLLWQGERVRAGIYTTHGWGFAQLGTQRVLVASGFVRIEPIPRLLLGGRADHLIRDVGAEAPSTLTRLLAAIGYRIALPIEAYLAFERAIPTTRAQAELPGSDAWELRTIGRVIF